ncbi:MAG: aconitate hydratase [Gammaproteobacteria bacterium]|nr:aconitate hydratase [Gammaproteobacteria bacterium]
MSNSFDTQTVLKSGGKEYRINKIAQLKGVARLPYSQKILLENLLRHEDGASVTKEHIEAVLNWDASAQPDQEIAYRPARVLMQDFTGVPAVVDLAAMRDAMSALGGDPVRINPLSPAELVIDHSVMVDHYGRADSMDLNAKVEFGRNRERYAFLRWGKQAFTNFQVVPPNTGIVHQVNLEYLARVVFTREHDGVLEAYPDTLVGTDSHTTMINGLGVLGWGVGGIEAEAAMLGQPVSMLIPQVVGFKFTGKLAEGATATDLVLTVTQMLRKHGVVGKFVEFFGDGLDHLPLADRATIGNMAPEYGATCGIFPIDKETLVYLKLSGRKPEQIALVEAYAREQGMFRETGAKQADYSDVLELDLGKVEPSIAGPKRPQDRVALSSAKESFRASLRDYIAHVESDDDDAVDEASEESFPASDSPAYSGSLRHDDAPREKVHSAAADSKGRPSKPTRVKLEDGTECELDHGAVAIAAITSCTNTSNPSVMIAAGLLAKKARALGLNRKPWVKTSLAPGSKVVTEYLTKSGLLKELESIGFYLVGYGCTTCIGNSGPLPETIEQAIDDAGIVCAAVLSGNRNFEGRIHPHVQMNYLASPPLVVAYALAGTMDIDLYKQSLGKGKDGKPVFMKDIWPSAKEIQEAVLANIDDKMFEKSYGEVFAGDSRWNTLDIPDTEQFDWDDKSTYVQNPPYFEGMDKEPQDIADIEGARVLAVLGDSITTDHISPAGSIKKDSPAGKYLQEHGVKPADFNSYGSRRGNHEIMMRGTFANVRLRNKLAPDTEGGWTTHYPSEEVISIYDAAVRYEDEGVPLVVLAGKEYGSGSSRDWAAKGPLLLGVRAVIAESYERIHRSNLVGMGILPLQFKDGDTAESLGFTGREMFAIEGLGDGTAKSVKVIASAEDGGNKIEFDARVRIDTPQEIEYYRHGGILHYVLRQLAA